MYTLYEIQNNFCNSQILLLKYLDNFLNNGIRKEPFFEKHNFVGNFLGFVYKSLYLQTLHQYSAPFLAEVGYFFEIIVINKLINNVKWT